MKTRVFMLLSSLSVAAVFTPSLRAKSNTAEYFSISNLIAGSSIEAVSAGVFKELSRASVRGDIESVDHLYLQLEMRKVQQKSLLPSGTPQFQSDKVELGLTSGSKQLLELPGEGL